MQIVWEGTGDWLDINPINPELADYWINALDQHSVNRFTLVNTGVDLTSFDLLNTHVCKVDKVLVDKFKITKLSKYVNADFANQTILNDLHRDWIGLIREFPKLVTFLASLGKEMLYHWDQINKKVHFIEQSFTCSYQAKEHWETPNVFGLDILNFDLCQVRISFSQQGRPSYDKWKVSDTTIDGPDTNDYLFIGSVVKLNLERPVYWDPPRNYVEYCTQKNMPVIGSRLNLGNFVDFDSKLTDIRHVYLRNVSNENNTALFKF